MPSEYDEIVSFEGFSKIAAILPGNSPALKASHFTWMDDQLISRHSQVLHIVLQFQSRTYQTATYFMISQDMSSLFKPTMYGQDLTLGANQGPCPLHVEMHV
jgi:hypothetical protein